MLRIRRQQLAALNEASRQAFLHKLESRIRSQHADLLGAATPEEVSARLSAAVATARLHRIDYESHVYQFAVLFLALGADFEQRPDARWAVEILKRALPAETRLYQLRESLLQRQGASPA